MITKRDRSLLLEDFKKVFVTKKDLKKELSQIRQEMATKDDLKREIQLIRDEMATKEDLQRMSNDIIEVIKDGLENVPTRDEFNALERLITRPEN